MAQLDEAKKLGSLLQQLAQLDPEADASDRRAKPKVTAENDLLLIDLGIGRFIVKTETGTVHRLKTYGAPLRNVAYPTLAAAIADHEEKLKTLKAGGEVDVTPTLNGWRIEKAKTGRGTCRVCGRGIAEGELRFGQDLKTATWFHLQCAAEGAPRAFRPFADKAAALQKTETAPAVPKGKSPPPEVVAALRKKPNDLKAQSVFADWLTGNGDPWGELITLERVGKVKEARAHFRKNAQQLCGGFGPRLLTWRNGFIESARLEGKSADALIEQVKTFFAVPQAMLVRELGVEVSPNAALFTAVSQHALPTVRSLQATAGPGLEALAIPQLEQLHLRVRNSPKGLEGLFNAKVPRLRSLGFMGKRGGQNELGDGDVVPLSFLEALLDSKLFAQLDSLELDFGSIDAAGADFLFAQRKKLTKVRALSIAVRRENNAAMFKALKKNFDAHSENFDRETERLEGTRVYS